MARRFSKRITKRKTYKLSPRDAETILQKEIIDSNGNKHKLRFRFKPHLPYEEGDMQLKYKQGEYDDNSMGY